MAHSLSSKKRIRQNTKRRARNRARTTALKTKVRKVQTALQKGSLPDAEAALGAAVKALDRAADQRTLHRNAVARRKSRLAKRLNSLRAKSGAAQ